MSDLRAKISEETSAWASECEAKAEQYRYWANNVDGFQHHTWKSMAEDQHAEAARWRRLGELLTLLD